MIFFLGNVILDMLKNNQEPFKFMIEKIFLMKLSYTSMSCVKKMSKKSV